MDYALLKAKFYLIIKPIPFERKRSTKPRKPASTKVTTMTTQVELMVCCLVGHVTFLSSLRASDINFFVPCIEIIFIVFFFKRRIAYGLSKHFLNQ